MSDDVYFAKQLNSDIWKIGHSIHPFARIKASKTFNAGEDFFVRYIAENDGLHTGRQLEKAVHNYFRKFRIKGELFNLLPNQVSELVKQINKEGFDFLFVRNS